MIRWVANSKTDVGLRREGNEDSLLVPDEGRLFAVADGMGGHAGGEVASSITVEVLESSIKRIGNRGPAELRRAILEANTAVYKRASSDDRLERMGTTVTAAWVDDALVSIAQVGDSRAYLFRDGELTRLTSDQTLVQQLLDSGEIDEEGAKSHPQRSFLTQAVGTEPDIDVVITDLIARENDRILLCTDGLHGYVPEDRITEIIAQPDAALACDELVREANAAGGHDNVTVIILDAVETSEESSTPVRQASTDAPNRRRVIGLAAAAVLVIALGAGIVSVLGSATTQYVVASRAGKVVVLKGQPASGARERPEGEVVLESGLLTADLPDTFVRDLETGIPRGSLDDAKAVIESIKLAVPRKLDLNATPSPSPLRTGSPSPPPAG